MRHLPPALLVLAATGHALACSFCGPNLTAKNTLREEFAQAKAVVAGTLRNPKANPAGVGGTTEFHFASTLKTAGIVEKRKDILLNQYFPVVGDTPPDYLLFLDERNGQPELTGGVPSSKAVVAYLSAAAKLDAKDAAKRLPFYFAHLDSADPTVSGDAFLEFAKASDADVVRAKASLDAKKLQRWLADPKTPAERIGVYAMMLGLCGEKADAAVFAGMLKRTDAAARANVGGILAGYCLLDPKGGWGEVRATFAAVGSFEERYAALTAAKYLQATRPKEHRADVLALYRDRLADKDFVDMAIEDLRRWGWWDLTADVLAVYANDLGKPPIVRKAVVRYALSCPDEAARAFVAKVRQADPKLVERVEESLKAWK